MNSTWKYFDKIIDGQKYEIDGIDLWSSKWIDTRRKVEIRDPIYHQAHSFSIYSIGNLKFAAGEFSNTVWGIYLEYDYLKFKQVRNNKSKLNENNLTTKFWSFISKTAENILPKANPDFDKLIDDVEWWLIEFESYSGIPNREIGLNKKNETIITMPNKRNYGYWTDNNLKLKDFINTFKTVEIESNFFEEKWNQYELNQITVEISDYQILESGADGGHKYLAGKIKYNNKNRRIAIFFKNKSDEKLLTSNSIKLTIKGNLIDEGENLSIQLLESILVKNE